MKATVSIILPTYNSARHIRCAIQSMLNQTYRDFELLVIDDGSSDDTEERVFSFKESRIRYLKRGHQGLSSALNYGLSVASSDIIARMDADDVAVPRSLEFLMAKKSIAGDFGTHLAT